MLKKRSIIYKKSRIFKILKKAKWTDIVSCFAIVVTATATTYYAWTTHNMLQMSQEPVVQIPQFVVDFKKTDNPELTLQNLGFNIADIRFFADYFVVWNTLNGEPAHQPFGPYLGSPQTPISLLKKGKSIKFTLKSFNERNKEMSDFCSTTENIKEKCPVKVVRITVNFRREVDNREFSISQLFNITDEGKKVILFPLPELRPGYTDPTIKVIEKVRSELSNK